MKLTSLKVSKPKKVLREKMAAEVMDAPEYPWGLELNFEDDTIKKLGVDFKNQAVGDEVNFTAKAKITRMSDDQSTMGSRKSMALQITSMGWGKAK